MSAQIFLSTVSDEFRRYRDLLRSDLTRHNVEVKVQEDFTDLGGETLDKLDIYIADCDAVVHLVGDMTGAYPGERGLSALLVKYLDLPAKLPPLGAALKDGVGVSYTQWEAWLALYHGKLLLIARAAETAERGPKYCPTDASRTAQDAHLARLRAAERYPGCTFTSPDSLAKYVFGSAILDLLVQAYAEGVGRERDAAEGFIHEMAAKVAWDPNLDFEGKKQAVRNAIDLYQKEISGGQTQTNIDAIVDQALARARSAMVARVLNSEAEALYEYGRDQGSNVHLTAAIAVRRKLLDLASSNNERRLANKDLGNALCTLGERESGTAHLEEAIEAYRAALDEWMRERVPLRWAAAQNNLGSALARLGERESGTARLEESVAAFRAALEERSRDCVPLDWAMTQNNLGLALWRLGERESGTARLEQAVVAYRAALEEWRRDRVPLYWAMTQNDLGAALWRLGERESGTAPLEESVAAFRAALEERSRDRVPLEWAMTQNNLGLALWRLGERESGTTRLKEAVAAYCAALQEYTRERVPLQWATIQNNLGNTLLALGERERETARLQEAVAAYRAALEGLSRGRVPLQWVATQDNLGNALLSLGQRESGTERLEEAVAVFDGCLTVTETAWPDERAQQVRSNRDEAMAEIARRSG